jgi:predicted P-loop ATPase
MKIRDLNISSKESKALKENKIRQIIEFLNENYLIRINRFKQSEKEIISKTKHYEFPPSLDDISLHLQENEIAVSDSILRKIINSPNQIKTFNPIQEYFDSLTPYAGVSHIDKLFNAMTAVNYDDQPEGYYQKRMLRVAKKWLVASVACSLNGDQNEVALGLIQEEEGTGKTSICEFICPEPLKAMMIKSDKEKNGFKMRDAFTENFFVLFDEFIGLTKFTAEGFKSTMSAHHLDVKGHNDPFPRRRQRIANALFTTNNKTGSNRGFLIPSLGTRRFACLHLESIDYENIMNNVNVDEFWAEALMLLNNGFDYKFGPDDFNEFKGFNQRFMIETNALQLIESNFTKPLNGSDGKLMKPSEILQYFVEHKVAGRDVLNELSPEKIGSALKQLGYQKEERRIKGIPSHPYRLTPLFM